MGRCTGNGFLHTLESDMGELPIIAGNLGVITEDVELLRDTFAFPGMRCCNSVGGERNNAFCRTRQCKMPSFTPDARQ